VIHEEQSRKYVTKIMVSVFASRDMVDPGVTNANQVIGAILTANRAAVVTPEVRLPSAHPTENVHACPTSQGVLVTSAHPVISNTQNASVSVLSELSQPIRKS
jgi:hypothetical protein